MVTNGNVLGNQCDATRTERMRVTVIGGGRVTDTESEYETARTVGRLLAPVTRSFVKSVLKRWRTIGHISISHIGRDVLVEYNSSFKE